MVGIVRLAAEVAAVYVVHTPKADLAHPAQEVAFVVIGVGELLHRFPSTVDTAFRQTAPRHKIALVSDFFRS